MLPWPPVLAAVSAGGIAVGFAEFLRRELAQAPWPAAVADSAWRALALVLLQVPPQPGDSAWLVGARLAAPAVAMTLVYVLLKDAIVTWIARRRVRAFAGHTVVVGWSTDAAAFVAAETRPVVVAATGPVPVATPAAAVVDLPEPSSEALHAAGLRQAARLLLLGPTAENLEWLGRLDVSGRRDPLDVILRIDSWRLARELLRDHRLVDSGLTASLVIVPYDRATTAARTLLATHPPGEWALLRGQPRVHVAVIGWSELTVPLLEQLARLSPCAGLATTLVDLFVPDAGRTRADILAVQPALLGADGPAPIELRLHQLDNRYALPTAGQIAAVEPGPLGSVSAIVVSVGDDEASTATAYALRRRTEALGRWSGPLFVDITSDSALTAHLRAAVTPAWHTRIVAFGTPGDICDADALFEREAAAAAVHRAYQVSRARLDGGPAPAARQPWRHLPATLRAANHRAVDHLPTKLLSVGHRLEPGTAPRTGEAIELPDAEFERLAALEHRSWEIDRRLEGWVPGPVRDDERRVQPFVGQSYEDLADEVRQLDREQIAALFRLLEGPGPQTVRRELHVGLLGHNVLDVDDVARIAGAAATLADELSAPPGAFLTFVTPLAPGADLVLTECLIDRLAGRVPHRLIALEAVPRELVIETAAADLSPRRVWTTTPVPAFASASDAATAMQHRIAGLLRSNPANADVRIGEVGRDLADWTEARRIDGYRIANAFLAQRCDIVIAFLDEALPARPGGTAEAVAWCRTPSLIPQPWRMASPRVPRLRVVP